MNNAKVDEVLVDIGSRLLALGFNDERWLSDKPLPLLAPTTTAIRHALWMCHEALTFPPEKLEKKMRWLGFIQGVLWMTGVLTIEAAKQANMPNEEK
jgi:hypothetical protein